MTAEGGPNLKLQRRGNHGESEIDGALTVRERDLITDRIRIDLINHIASRSPSTSWVCRIPLPHGHGSVRVASEDHRRGNRSFFHVRSGAAGGAKLKLQTASCRIRGHCEASIITFLLFLSSASLQAQSCAMCKTSAQALSNVWALNVGIILLLIPPLAIMPAFVYLAFKGRS